MSSARASQKVTRKRRNGSARRQIRDTWKRNTILGVSYRDGQGVAQDFHEALTWFAKAADRGYSAAQFTIGLMYSDGQGVPGDLAKAVTWFRKSADQDYPPAEFNMGVLYAAGMGVPVMSSSTAYCMCWLRAMAFNAAKGPV